MYGSRGEPGEAKALKRNFNAVYGAYRSAGNFFKASAKHWSLQAATAKGLLPSLRRACRSIAVSLWTTKSRLIFLSALLARPIDQIK